MDYRPRYSQPFTFAEVVQLDVAVITEEIARLQNSLAHLRRTQEELRAASDASPDPELIKIMEENEVVIGSQQERIRMLKMALTEKGIRMGSHYDLPQEGASQGTVLDAPLQAQHAPAPSTESERVDEHDEDGGIHL
ncbi:uncharacterized protein LAESUDRAFT_718755 [Laetiporus sulphureus 93-53]|uniref:Uncharacterized protein n=1 Tax=Laetiporus sulphureus 93-53 TaxID=1314785 RepID=A0A165I263_9APHY|nr:uncharacterized protein LAESUDRAFT_718755 [Laetiporus sulphureus 93-53]KZT12494.1 hypothetical protein LAESUDRAFT_718755 [Laetiporus sulphureus 93-53]